MPPAVGDPALSVKEMPVFEATDITSFLVLSSVSTTFWSFSPGIFSSYLVVAATGCLCLVMVAAVFGTLNCHSAFCSSLARGVTTLNLPPVNTRRAWTFDRQLGSSATLG